MYVREVAEKPDAQFLPIPHISRNRKVISLSLSKQMRPVVWIFIERSSLCYNETCSKIFTDCTTAVDHLKFEINVSLLSTVSSRTLAVLKNWPSRYDRAHTGGNLRNSTNRFPLYYESIRTWSLQRFVWPFLMWAAALSVVDNFWMLVECSLRSLHSDDVIGLKTRALDEKMNLSPLSYDLWFYEIKLCESIGCM